ncbi:hypothetical protein Acsp01_56790 [Actinoplanes sp. NBRC 101535]|nr:hypothetical protein Acsp01_56790 [Actinoplanes sp. NBRC 101535]
MAAVHDAEQAFLKASLKKLPGCEWQAREPLVTLSVERGDFEALRARADAGDSHAAGRLAECGDWQRLDLDAGLSLASVESAGPGRG